MKDKRFPRLLVISHNLFDRTNNVGKTLQSLLSRWPKDELFSLYFRNEKPSSIFCNEYFLLDDKDVLKAFLTFGLYKSGEQFDGKKLYSNTCTETEKGLYRLGNQRKPFISLARDIVWRLSPWNNQKLKSWLNKINPDIILFVPNDYELAFDVLKFVMNNTTARLFTYYMDDIFYYGQNVSGINKIRRKRLMIRGKDVAKQSKCIFTTCKLMSKEYEQLFAIKCYPFGNCINIVAGTYLPHSIPIISYIGNLHSNRWKSLMEIGIALKNINNKNGSEIKLNVYSASDISERVRRLLSENTGIRFCGSLTPKEVVEKQLSSDILVHVEAMDEKNKASTRLSISTKIFEYLSVGRAIFAYGPKDIASMQYLEETGASINCFSVNEIQGKLEKILFSKSLQSQLASNGIFFAYTHCNIKAESQRFERLLREYDVTEIKIGSE